MSRTRASELECSALRSTFSVDRRSSAPPLLSPRQLRGNLRRVPALVPGDRKLVLARQTLTLRAGDGAGAIGRTPGDFVHREDALFGVRHADDHHALMKQEGHHAHERRFLPTVL